MDMIFPLSCYLSFLKFSANYFNMFVRKQLRKQNDAFSIFFEDLKTFPTCKISPQISKFIHIHSSSLVNIAANSRLRSRISYLATRSGPVGDN
jgi:hypothetical protein